MIDTFKEAFIGIPKYLTKNKQDIYTTLNELYFSNVVLKDKKIPLVFYVSGSAGFTKGNAYREWIVQNTNAIFFSPNSFKIKDRPLYNEDSSIEEYEKVHKIRQEEIKYNIDKLSEYDWIDREKIFLMGNSEGATAAGIYKGNEFFSRLLLAWNCEAGYYISDSTLGAKLEDPILSIIGRDDEYFSKESKPNIGSNINGNCIESFKFYKNAKSIVYSNTKHNLLNDNVKNDVISFIKQNL